MALLQCAHILEMLTNVVGGDMKKEREEVRTLVYATWYWSLRVSGRRDADGVHVGLLKSTLVCGQLEGLRTTAGIL